VCGAVQHDRAPTHVLCGSGVLARQRMELSSLPNENTGSLTDVTCEPDMIGFFPLRKAPVGPPLPVLSFLPRNNPYGGQDVR
jgi:hypothetical protein